jgi:hypothetical protein
MSDSPGFVIFAVVSFDVIEGVGARLIPPRARRVGAARQAQGLVW